jgi:hypothetical protein
MKYEDPTLNATNFTCYYLELCDITSIQEVGPWVKQARSDTATVLTWLEDILCLKESRRFSMVYASGYDNKGNG